MVSLWKMVIFHGYVSHNQMAPFKVPMLVWRQCQLCARSEHFRRGENLLRFESWDPHKKKATTSEFRWTIVTISLSGSFCWRFLESHFGFCPHFKCITSAQVFFYIPRWWKMMKNELSLTVSYLSYHRGVKIIPLKLPQASQEPDGLTTKALV